MEDGAFEVYYLSYLSSLRAAKGKDLDKWKLGISRGSVEWKI